jgi:transcriptional regulator GlxA family with amidase domain
MKPGDNNRPVAVSLLAAKETTPAALHGLLEVFSYVGVIWGRITGEETQVRRIEPRIVSADGKPFASPVGIPVAPQAALAHAGNADIVIVSDLDLTSGLDAADEWEAETSWLRDQYDAGATICSVCTGSVLLAEAGLLDGLEATTHWSAADALRVRYPKVKLRPERILCPAGPEHRIVTSGGSASWEDLVLYLVARFCGEAEAVRIAKVYLLGDRSEGQLVFSALGRPRNHDDPVIAGCQGWIAEHYAAPNPVARMVEQSGLAERTFKRRFKAATGYAPVDYVQALRLEEAKQMLETTADAPDAIAYAIGYQDPTFFRRMFKRRTGVTPSRYRQRFRWITNAAR